MTKRILLLLSLFLAVPVRAEKLIGPAFTPGMIPKVKDVLGCIDVRSYGVQGDGATDDTAALNAAITAAQAAGAKAAAICLPGVTIKVTSTVAFGNTTVIGEGSAYTVIDGSTITNSDVVTVGAVGGLLSNFKIKGPSSPAGTSSACLHGTAGSYHILFAIETSGCYRGFFLEAGSFYTLIRPLVSSFGAIANAKGIELGSGHSRSIIVQPMIPTGLTGAFGISISSGANNVIIGGSVYAGTNNGTGTGSHAIYSAGSDNLFSGVYAAGAGGAGNDVIKLDAGSARNVIIGSTVVGVASADASVNIAAGTNNSISDSYLQNKALIDSGTGTVLRNVNNNGTVIPYKDANLPSASPGAGSKQLWYDGADSNRVKYAP